MHEIIDIFLANITLIIAFMYISLKIKEVFVTKVKGFYKYIWLAPFLISLLSIWVMHHPLFYEGMRIDLRGVPIFFISYLGGWKFGAISIILPILYRIDLGGPTVIQGITQVILVPYLIGAIFHRPKTFNPPYTLLNLKHMLMGFVVYELIKSLLMIWTTPANYQTILLMFIFEVFALVTIGIMNNDTNQNSLIKKELEFQSRHDNMTNLYNLRYFKSKVDILITQNKPFVIAMFDVDYFKNYNDTHGHPAGDVVLRMIGQLLTVSMREEDVFARYGGEEFIICFSNVTSSKTAIKIAERFRFLVETYPFPGEEKQPNGTLTISIGLSSASNNKKLDLLIEEADQALYIAKKLGKNNVQVYEQKQNGNSIV